MLTWIQEQANAMLHRLYGKVPSPKNIWDFRQNIPELVVQDLAQLFDLSPSQQAAVRGVLMARGVNKWLKVRRDLIAHKKILKHRIRALQLERERLRAVGEYQERARLKVLLREIERERSILVNLCMTERWQEWPESTHRDALKQMNTIRARD